MADEEGDLLGGLPRSRPGVRSGKRASTRPAKPAAAKAQARPAQKRVTRPKPSGSRPRPGPAPPPREPAPGATEEALRLATGAAGAVFGTASSVTRGILRRLPKP